MTGIIVTVPPSVELPPGNTSGGSQILPGITYTYALLNLAQTWTAKQTFPLGNISVQAGDIQGALFALTTTGTSGAATYIGGTLNIPQYAAGTPGGTNTQVQYNNSGSFAGISGATTNGTTLTLSSPVFTGTTTANAINSAANTITSASANALAVGPNGTTNPVFQVDGSAASQANGVKITPSLAGGGVVIGAISSATNEPIGLNAKGSSGVFIGQISTGPVSLGLGGGGVTVASALTYGGVTLSNAVTGTGNMVLSASPTFTGTIGAAAFTASGTVNFSGLTASTALALDGSKNVVSVTNTGSGSNVLATSPTLVTPVLGAATATTINGAAIDNNAWSTYTPTITAATGTPTTVTAAGRYKQIGKLVFLNVNITVTSVGTASSLMYVPLPINSLNTANFAGFTSENSIAGTSGSGTIVGASNNTRAQIVRYDNATLWVNGYTINLNLVYEIP